MSCYETHTGTLKKVECASIEQFLKDKLDSYKIAYNDKYDAIDLLYIDNRIYDKYILLNGTLYEWIHHYQVDDMERTVQCDKNSDGTINIIAQFYNGGACLEEVLEDMPMFKD